MAYHSSLDYESPERISQIQSIVLENQKILYETKEFSDCTIILSDGEIQAHKFVLYAQSKFFAGLFRNEPKDEIYLVNYEISHNTMDAVLKYLYYGHFEKPLARDLLAAADMLDIKELLEICETLLMHCISKDSCVEDIIFAYNHNAPRMELMGIDYFITSDKDLVDLVIADFPSALCKRIWKRSTELEEKCAINQRRHENVRDWG